MRVPEGGVEERDNLGLRARVRVRGDTGLGPRYLFGGDAIWGGSVGEGGMHSVDWKAVLGGFEVPGRGERRPSPLAPALSPGSRARAGHSSSRAVAAGALVAGRRVAVSPRTAGVLGRGATRSGGPALGWKGWRKAGMLGAEGASGSVPRLGVSVLGLRGVTEACALGAVRWAGV